MHCVVKNNNKKTTPQVEANKRLGLSLGLQMLVVHLLYEPSAMKRGKNAAEAKEKWTELVNTQNPGNSYHLLNKDLKLKTATSRHS